MTLSGGRTPSPGAGTDEDAASRGGSFPLKVALGYALLVAVMVAALLFIRYYTRSAIQLTDVEQAVSARRSAVNRLVYSLLDVENRERAVCMGQTDSLPGYELSVARAQASADTLAALLADPIQRSRVDTLRMLLDRRRDNTLRLSRVLAERTREHIYESRAERLRSGRDSLVVSSKTGSITTEKQVTYVVEKTRPTFFGRLADAFRRSKSDTTAMYVDTVGSATVPASVGINVADTVAGVLTDVGRREEQLRRRRRDRIHAGAQALQSAGMELTVRASQLLEDIGRTEQQWMQKAGGEDAARRRSTVVRIGIMAASAAVAALILFALVWRDNRRAARYRRRLDEARLRAEHLLEQRERLLLTITHDIKSPVAAISGFTELLMPHVSEARPRAFLDNIRSSALHLLRLVGELLDYHQLEQGRISVSEVAFSPVQLLADCTDSFRPRAADKGLNLVMRCSGGIPAMCRGDAFRIRQIVENLVGNALKYTDNGSVTVEVGGGDGRLTLSVADTGRGMTAEESRRIFRAFTRLPSAQGVEGVGLGLSITRELITLLGGTISLDTAPGRGSTFTVSLPVGDVAADAVLPEASAAATMPEEATVGSLNILAVDDDPLQLQLLTEMLRRLSAGRWTVVACSRIDDMLSRVASGGFDLLLTDIEMPGMNGFEIASRLRHSGLPVVAMTAHDSISAADFARAGFAACLRKPFTAASLASAIGSVVPVSTSASASASDAHPPAEQRFAALTAFADGDEDAARDILDKFFMQTETDAATLRRAAETSDVALAGETAHRLIPVFKMIESPVVPILRRIADARRADTVPSGFSAWCIEAAEEMLKVKDD